MYISDAGCVHKPATQLYLQSEGQMKELASEGLDSITNLD